MRNLELAMINRMLNEPDEFNDFSKYDIDTDLMDEDTAIITEFIVEHYSKYGKVPTCLTVKQIYPKFEEVEAEEPVEFYCIELQKRFSYNKLSSIIEEVTQMDTESEDFGNVIEMVDKVENAVKEIRVIQGATKDIDYSKTAGDRIDDYKGRKISKGLLGVKTPWATLNELTGGFQKSWLITLQGLAKEGKTWVALILFKYFERMGAKCGIFSNEMSVEQMNLRLDSLTFRLPYIDLKRATLSPAEERRYFRGLNRMKMFKKKNSIVILGGGSVSYITSKIKEHKLDCFLVDGAYLLDDERNSSSRTDKMYNITQDLKRVVMKTETFGMITLQLQPDEAKKLHDRGNPMGLFGTQWARSSSQDSDVVIEIVSNENMKEGKIMGMHLVGQRDGDTGKWFTGWDFQKMDFPEIEEGQMVMPTSIKNTKLKQKFGTADQGFKVGFKNIGTKAS